MLPRVARSYWRRQIWRSRTLGIANESQSDGRERERKNYDRRPRPNRAPGSVRDRATATRRDDDAITVRRPRSRSDGGLVRDQAVDERRCGRKPVRTNDKKKPNENEREPRKKRQEESGTCDKTKIHGVWSTTGKCGHTNWSSAGNWGEEGVRDGKTEKRLFSSNDAVGIISWKEMDWYVGGGGCRGGACWRKPDV